MQDAIVGLIVTGCALYAAWTLMPASTRRSLAGQGAKLPLPARVRARLQARAVAAAGCGCNGCDQGGKPAAAPGAPRPVQFIRKLPR